jgi:hypothetical protein
MKLTALPVLIVLSTLLLGLYALIWLISPYFHHGNHGGSNPLLTHSIGVAGLALAAMAVRGLHRQRDEVAQLKADSEGFV